jgi:cytochrome P450
MPYSPSFTAARKLVHREFSKKKIPTYHQTIELASHRLLRRLLTKPKLFEHHVRECVGADLLSIVYGYQVKGDNDHMVDLIERSVARFSEAVAPGAYMVSNTIAKWRIYNLLTHIP